MLFVIEDVIRPIFVTPKEWLWGDGACVDDYLNMKYIDVGRQLVESK